MMCPTCNTELKMSERAGIEIDYCPKCRGVWLDRGELDKIIEKSASETPSVDPRKDDGRRENPAYKDKYYDKPRKYDDDDKYYGHKKRKSFLGDLFDF